MNTTGFDATLVQVSLQCGLD